MTDQPDFPKRKKQRLVYESPAKRMSAWFPVPDYAFVRAPRIEAEVTNRIHKGQGLSALRCGHAEGGRTTTEFLTPEQVEAVEPELSTPRARALMKEWKR